MGKSRKRYSPREKIAVLREHLIDRTPVADICDKYGLQPTVFYRWQKDLFEKGALVFERDRRGEQSPLRRDNDALKQKLAQKDMVIAEIMEDFVAVKKTLGEN